MKINVISYILAFIFLLSGGAKLAGLEFELVAFERWGYPVWFMYLTGIAEVSGGVALAANILRRYAAPSLSLLMIGAIATHVRHSEWPMLMIALVIFSLAVVLSVSLWKSSSTSEVIQ